MSSLYPLISGVGDVATKFSMTVWGQSRLYQLGFDSMVANLVDFHLMSLSGSEGNITNLSTNEVIVLIISY